MNIICMILAHNWKVVDLVERQGKYFHIEKCKRCGEIQEIPSVVNDIKVKCSSTCPTCHGKY